MRKIKLSAFLSLTFFLFIPVRFAQAVSVQWTTGSQAKGEAHPTTKVTAKLSAVSPLNVVVPFTLSGTAANGSDYTILNSAITIPAGTLKVSTTISIIDDLIVEPNEFVILTMGIPVNATLGFVTNHSLMIVDND